MRMRSMVFGMVLTALVAGQPTVGAAHQQSPSTEFGLAMASAGINVFWLPVKVVTAGLGLALGSVTGVLTGGDVRSAYAVWVPTASGTYVVTPAHLEGTEDLMFFGDDYADRPSAMPATTGSFYNGSFYDEAYIER